MLALPSPSPTQPGGFLTSSPATNQNQTTSTCSESLPLAPLSQNWGVLLCYCRAGRQASQLLSTQARGVAHC